MASSLQSKVQLLTVIFAIFILLAVPTFAQVIDDARESRSSAKTTALYKFGKDIRKLFGNDPGNLVVDDFQKWQEEQLKNGCDPKICDAEGDLDGDGRSNKEEWNSDQGWNPNCNEEQMGGGDVEEGKRRCADVPPVPTTTPTPTGPVQVPPYTKTLFRGEISLQAAGQFNAALPPDDKGYYNRWEVYWNASGLTGAPTGYQIEIEEDDAQRTPVCCRRDQPDALQQRDFGSEFLEGDELPAPGPYIISVRVDAESVEQNARWDVTVVGLRYAYEEPPGATHK